MSWLAAGHDRLAASASTADAVAVVESFAAADPAQAQARCRVLAFVDEHPDALSRSCLAGHLTASAWVVDADARAGLLLLHAKVGRWLQPGGHADGDACLAAVALRECAEETGIAGLEVWSDPVDVDVHLFRNRTGAEPDHLHLDVRYLVRAPRGAVPAGNHESEQLRWVSEADLAEPDFDLDESVLRLARCGFDCARRNG